MTFDEDDRVVLHDQHSEYDGQEGTVTQVMETMFGDANYTVSFEDGQEQGVPEDSLVPAEDDGGSEGDEDDSDDASGETDSDDESGEADDDEDDAE